MSAPTESSTVATQIAVTAERSAKLAVERRLLQFSLRAALVLFTLVSIGLGWLGIQIDHARRQRQAIEGMKNVEVWYTYDPVADRDAWPVFEKGAPAMPALVRRICGDNIFADAVCLQTDSTSFKASDLMYISALGTLEWLFIYTPRHEKQVTDSDLAPIHELSCLKGLTISSSSVTDAGLKSIAGLRNLERLDLSSAKVSGTGLSHLRGCKRLRWLELRDAQITEQGALHIGALESLEDLTVTPGIQTAPVGDSILKSCAKLRLLRHLNLAGTHVTGAGLRHLRGITTLELLILYETQVSGEGLKELLTLPALASLELSGTPISDADLRHIGRLSNLEELHLGGTSITDEGLAQLATLEKLEYLDLQHTDISDEGLLHLRALKNLRALVVYKTRVTKRGVEQLGRMLPRLGKRQ